MIINGIISFKSCKKCAKKIHIVEINKSKLESNENIRKKYYDNLESETLLDVQIPIFPYFLISDVKFDKLINFLSLPVILVKSQYYLIINKFFLKVFFYFIKDLRENYFQNMKGNLYQISFIIYIFRHEFLLIFCLITIFKIFLISKRKKGG